MLTPYNKIKFDFVNWKCLEGCDTSNEEKLQLLIDKVCVDYTKVNLKCLEEDKKESPLDILNLLVLEICKLKGKTPSTNTNTSTSNTGIDISKITLCGRDNFTYTYIDCLEIVNTCFPTLTIEAMMSAIIKRLNANSFSIQQLHLLTQQQATDINFLKTKITQLETKLNNCCS